MVMRRLLRGGGPLGEVDLGYLSPENPPPTDELSVARRNALIAEWVARVAGVSREEAASDIPRLLGLALARPRLAGLLIRAKPSTGGDHAAGLAELYELELRCAQRAIVEAVPAASLRLVEDQFGPFSGEPVFAARIYLLSRRLRAFGGRTLASAITAAKGDALSPLTPIAPFGPLRMQTERAIRDLKDPMLAAQLLPMLAVPFVLAAERTAAANSGLIESLLNADLVPRAMGTFLRPSQPIYVIAFEHPARSTRDRAQLGMVLLGLLEDVLERIRAGSIQTAVNPLGIDLWLLDRGKLARNVGWRELGSHDDNVSFTKRTMIEFVEGSVPIFGCCGPWVLSDVTKSSRGRRHPPLLRQGRR